VLNNTTLDTNSLLHDISYYMVSETFYLMEQDGAFYCPRLCTLGLRDLLIRGSS
jgi:hypothetical protein